MSVSRAIRSALLAAGIAAILTTLSVCCNDEDDEDKTAAGDLVVSDLAQDSCVGDGSEKAVAVERVRLVAGEDGLDVVHENTCRNCGFTATVDAEIGDGTLVIREGDTGENPAMCDCLHHVGFHVSGVTDGNWAVEWHEIALDGTGTTLFKKTFDLVSGEEQVVEIGSTECG